MGLNGRITLLTSMKCAHAFIQVFEVDQMKLEKKQWWSTLQPMAFHLVPAAACFSGECYTDTCHICSLTKRSKRRFGEKFTYMCLFFLKQILMLCLKVSAYIVTFLTYLFKCKIWGKTAFPRQSPQVPQVRKDCGAAPEERSECEENKGKDMTWRHSP